MHDNVDLWGVCMFLSLSTSVCVDVRSVCDFISMCATLCQSISSLWSCMYFGVFRCIWVSLRVCVWIVSLLSVCLTMCVWLWLCLFVFVFSGWVWACVKLAFDKSRKVTKPDNQNVWAFVSKIEIFGHDLFANFAYVIRQKWYLSDPVGFNHQKYFSLW